MCVIRFSQNQISYKKRSLHKEQGSALVEAALTFPLLIAVISSIFTYGLAIEEEASLVESGRVVSRIVQMWPEVDADPVSGNLDDLIVATEGAVYYWLKEHSISYDRVDIDIQVVRLASAADTPFVRIGLRSSAPQNFLTSFIKLKPCFQGLGRANVSNVSHLPEVSSLTPICS